MTVEDHSQHRSGKPRGKAIAFLPARIPPQANLRVHDIGWLLALGFAAGAAVFFLSHRDPLPFLGLALAGAGGAFWLMIRRASVHTARPLALGSVLVMVAFGLGHQRAEWRTASVEAKQVVLPESPVLISGWVIALEAGDPIRVRIMVTDLEGVAPEQQPRIVRVSHRSDLRIKPGRFVSCRAQLLAPPAPSVPGDYAFARQSWFDGLDAVGFALGACRPAGDAVERSLLQRGQLWLAAQRHAVAERIVGVAGTDGATLAATLVTGDRSVLGPATIDALRASGLAHLLAISGLHMALAGGAVFFFLRRALAWIEPLALRFPIPKIAAISALLACTIYLVFSGASVSAQRAYIMAVIAFGAIVVDRPALSMRGLALAMIIVLLLHPEAVLTPGFQMSFAAAAALVASFGHDGWLSGGEGRGPVRALRDTAATSVIAGLATAPISAFHFAQLTVWGYLANLLAMPIVSFLTAPLAVLAVTLSGIGLGEWPMRLFSYSLDAVISIAAWVASLPGARHPIGLIPDMTLPIALVGIGLATAIKGWPGFVAAILTAATVLLLSAVGGFRPNVYISETGTIYAASASGGWDRFTQDGARAGLGPMAITPNRARPATCGTQPCRLLLDGFGRADTDPRSVLIADDTEAMRSACNASADLLISRTEVVFPCTGPDRIITGIEGRGLALYLGPSGIRQKRAPDINRPWTRERTITSTR